MLKSIPYRSSLAVIGLAALLGPAKAQAIQEKLMAADAAVARASIDVEISRTIRQNGSVTHTTEKSHRVYQSGDRYSLDIRLQSDAGPSSQTMAWEGKSCVAVDATRKQSVVSQTKAYYDARNYDLVGLTNGPCLPLGRGLSALKDIEMSGPLAGPVITGVAADGSILTATLDPEHEFLPVRVRRSFKNSDMWVDWTYKGIVRSKEGVLIPETVSAIQHGGELQVDTTFHFTSISTNPPQSADLGAKWFVPGYRIIDNRVSPAISFTYNELLRLNNNDPDLTLAQLEVFTRERLAAVEKQRAATERATRKQSGMPAWITPVGICTAGFASLVLLMAVRRQGK
jgi:hypothetical protein